jgi:hypothetical protein
VSRTFGRTEGLHGVEHLGGDEHVLQGAVIVFINVVVVTRVLKGLFTGGFWATMLEILLAVEVERVRLPDGHFQHAIHAPLV